MKTIYNLFVVCLLLTASTLEAQVVRTFSNRDGETSEFNTLQEVIDASADGDFIYVSGSSNSYGDININKRINLIGAGHNPATADGLRSSLGTVIFQNGSSDSRLAGFTILQASYSGSQINNVIIQRNFIQFNVFVADFQNWIFEENIINSISSLVSPNFEERFIFRNNIISGVIQNINHSLFSNNVFLSSGGIFSGSFTNIFGNNIFFQNNLNSNFNSPGAIVNSTFNNNIFFGQDNPSSLPTTNGNTGVDNIFSNPLFVNAPNNSFSYDHNYSLQAGSPGLTGGVGGSQIGLFGGIGYTVSGEPAVPQVTLLNILNPIVPQNGDLNVRIEGRANN
ncbi:right-handed parallel beta-helix repeat-containing protein [Mongoliitalea daihaiensis]|uniref:hypothetical protein n=1 Tax=Mongoliitalea daihaiensis TaxID=2782006 RepID=UPI001F310946|nr:hypothetical protein [Mongoliitalea daihaiensis]UJP64394.1 hypothetical protein IPZ59_16530 [Mongoliitalea daihaiensis]